MAKQKLTFKIEGGLDKVSELYAASNNAADLQTYGENPAALLQALSITSEKEIRISSGYKKLAEEMGNIDFGQWLNTFEPATEESARNLQIKPLTSLWQTVNGYTPVIQAITGKAEDSMNMVVEMITVVAAVAAAAVWTSVSMQGRTPRKPPAPKMIEAAENSPTSHAFINMQMNFNMNVNYNMNMSTNGRTPRRNPPAPKMIGAADIAYMSRHAQMMAEHVGWFSK
jgi:hypothetical protein